MTKPVFIIAEAGVNHNGSIELAKKLIDAAVAAGVDAVKFQTFVTENCVVKSAPKADYQVSQTGKGDSQFEMLKKLELTHENHEELLEYCQRKNIMFFSTGFDLDSLSYLKSLGFNLAKIPSGEITNLPYLRKIASDFDHVIMSTGMANIKEIEEAIQALVEAGLDKQRLTILHCNTEYPTPMVDVNLKAMLHIKDIFDVNVGYSDHTLGIEIPTAAVALGATVIEKHFTLSRDMSGPDHAASLEPDELKAMVKAIRNIELALSGSGIKEPSVSEKKNTQMARKSIVSKGFIKKGEPLTEGNLTVKRPATGISPMKWDKVVGQIADKDYQPDDLIEINM